ncbi:FtsX-like permease family protein [Niastella caeni]|uniref:FtsX-like permease family protein n=1 Tax=Niastella caeni TaxID=2569763 RepID=A0A4S8HKI3_9BACT|nr:ABC transporter permease [Niastella caeni]THU34849.1 FtsX-like permease family protein [Niastella caeni]
MFTTYFKIAIRCLLKNKVFSAINILGLSIGMAVCFIILLFVRDELSYDRFNVKANNMYRVVFKANVNGGKINESNVMPPVASALKNDYPEVKEVTRLRTLGNPRLLVNGKLFTEASMVFVDSNFFNVFTIPLIQGDPNTALLLPYSIVISKAMAQKYFGNENPLGKLINRGKDKNNPPFTVTGVFDKIPANSHFHFDLFGSMITDPDQKSDSWLSSNYYTYVVLPNGYDHKKLEAKLPRMVEKYMGPQIQQNMGLTLAQFRTKGNELGFTLEPLTKIHLFGNSNTEFEPGGDIRYIYIFSAVALFMLLIACINFINLSTAGAAKRAKEVGVRKVMGSRKQDLIKQFLLESALITTFALCISAVLVQLALPIFNDLAGKNLSFGFQLKPMAALTVLGLLVSILAGLYPAFFLSSFKPIATLKGKFITQSNTYNLRSGLIVFQFFIAICLITGTIVVYQQMKFIQTTKVGYNKEQLLVLNNSWALGKNEPVFRDQLLNDPRIENVTISGYKPVGPSFYNNALAYPEGRDNQLLNALEYRVDERYIPTLGMQLVTGRNFSPVMQTDSLAMIINETAARAFGWGNSAIGKKIFREHTNRGNHVAYTVIGVVKDFHFKSLREAITPLLMVLHPETGLIVRVKTKDIPGLLASMKQQWAAFKPEEPFSWSFIDELYNKTYAAEQKTGRILNIFTVLTILVACLGLFGLATYTAEQRAKEIGIRKVLGASVTQVTSMLSKEFLKLVVIACIIAFPLSYWIMHQWLLDFAYRVNLNAWMFIAAGLIAIIIALGTVSVQSIKAAMTNPVKSLRSE